MIPFARISEPLAIAACGGGGFRFGKAFFPGSLLILRSGVYSWPVARIDELDAETLLAAFTAEPPGDFLLMGTGAAQIFLPPAIASRLAVTGLAVEIMATPPACRTYNLLFAEQRHFAAALIAI
jgi:uncharacterized protein